MISLLQTAYTKKFVVLSVAGILALASTMILVPVFAQSGTGILDVVDTQKGSDHSIRVSFEGDFQGEHGGDHDGAKVFLTSSGGDVKFTCANAKDKGPPHTNEANFGELKGETKEFRERLFTGDVSLGPPSLSAKDLCHNAKFNVKIDSITYNDVKLHGIPDVSDGDPPTTDNLGNIDP